MHPMVTPARDRMRRVYTQQATAPRTRASCWRRAPPSPSAVPTSCSSRRISIIAPRSWRWASSLRREGIPLAPRGSRVQRPRVSRGVGLDPALMAIVGAEADFTLPAIVADVRSPATTCSGTPVSSSPTAGRARPPRRSADLARLPVPDFTDFPWDAYRTRVMPVMAARGCGWGRCLFCADIESANGRTFRSRPADAVLDEVAEQSARHDSRGRVPRHQAQRRPRALARHRRGLPAGASPAAPGSAPSTCRRAARAASPTRSCRRRATPAWCGPRSVWRRAASG